MSNRVASLRMQRNVNPGQVFGEFARQSEKSRNGGHKIDRTSVRLGQIAVALVTAACPEKPAYSFAAWAGIGERAAGHIINGRNGISLDAFFRLLNSPIGRDLWDRAWTLAPMPDWHLAQQALLQAAEAEQDAKEALEVAAAIRRRMNRT